MATLDPVRPSVVTEPRRARRTGIVWFWPTLALIGIGLGVLGIVDQSTTVPDGAYPALALGITAAMLVIGSFVGRPGGLILLGALSLIILSASTALGGSFGRDAHDLRYAPATAAQVQPSYDLSVGQIRLDLSHLSDPQALAGRTIDLTIRTGQLYVVVPRSLNLDVDARVDLAGGITVPGNDSGGWHHAVTESYQGVGAPAAQPPLRLHLRGKFGQITVVQE